jgi:uncharacterized DUF497 family protein
MVEDNMQLLRDRLIDYREITQSIVEALSSEDYDRIESILERRQAIIGEIAELSYAAEEFKQIAEQLDIISIQKTADSLLNEKYSNLKTELKRISTNKNINRNYNQNNYVDSIFFNKKI